MPNPLSKVHPGDDIEITAATWNKFVGAAQDYENRQQNLGAAADTPELENNLVLIKNNTNPPAVCPRYGILGIDDVLIEYHDNKSEYLKRVTLKGSTPDGETHASNFVITVDPIKPGAIGRAWLSGVTPVRIFRDNFGHGYADILAGSTTDLLSGETGSAQVLNWSSPGLGEQWAIVRFGTSTPAASVGAIRPGVLRDVDIASGLNDDDHTYSGEYIDQLGGDWKTPTWDASQGKLVWGTAWLPMIQGRAPVIYLERIDAALDEDEYGYKYQVQVIHRWQIVTGSPNVYAWVPQGLSTGEAPEFALET